MSRVSVDGEIYGVEEFSLAEIVVYSNAPKGQSVKFTRDLSKRRGLKRWRTAGVDRNFHSVPDCVRYVRDREPKE